MIADLIPVKASGWMRSNLEKEGKDTLIQSGIIPINDIFFPLWDDESKIKLYYGGYGSGKSDWIATYLIKEARKPGYFKCFYGRKIYDKVRQSCHSKLVSIIERHGLQKEFSYSKEPNGSMVITHRETLNTLHPFGAASPDDMKSVDDPTHIWMEESDQFTEKDLQVLLSRLRTPKAPHHLILTFNTEKVFPGHWILQYFFPEQMPDKECNEELMRSLAEVKTRKIFCNYPDNYFIDRKAYYNTLVISAGGDELRLQAIASGAWGAFKTGQEFYSQFNKNHIVDIVYNPDLPLHISFDDNVNPYLPCGIFQIHGKKIVMIDEIASRPPNNRITKICAEISRKYTGHTAGMFIYGDATAKKDDTKVEAGHNFFRLVMDNLKQFRPQKRVPESNPSVVMRGNFINTVLEMQYDGCEFTISKKCVLSINDLSKVQTSADGGKHKQVTKDPDSGVSYQIYGHFSDLIDYIMCWVWRSSFEKYQRGDTKVSVNLGKNYSKNAY